jgi:hypothetical protein
MQMLIRPILQKMESGQGDAKERSIGTRKSDVGNSIGFGHYKWRVLDARGGRALLLTEDVIEKRPYNTDVADDVTWEKCTLRRYLNGEFFQSFSSADQARILQTDNINADNRWYGTKGGNNTIDKIFLLSIEEVVKYFGDSGAFAQKEGNDIEYYYWENSKWNIIHKLDLTKWCCYSDQYSGARIAKYKNDACWWWLRSLGIHSDDAANVYNDGFLDLSGDNVDRSDGGVRPALWLNL